MAKITKVFAIALEAVGTVTGISGLAVECTLHADIGYVLITVGAIIIASGALAWKFVKI